jgi:hypothetical protein
MQLVWLIILGLRVRVRVRLIRARKPKQLVSEMSLRSRRLITNVNYASSRVDKTRLQQLSNCLSTATITESSVAGEYFKHLVAYALAICKECRHSVLPS